jgi:hypothetical protein
LSNARVHKYTGHNFQMRIHNDSKYNKDTQCRFCACPTCNHKKYCNPCKCENMFDCFKGTYCGIYESSVGCY